MTTPRNRASGHVRIIGGQWRGRKIPVHNSDGLRPTTDRTKETLFNWLMHDIRDKRCLDAFAGTGSLGLEALSRGARSQTFFEYDKATAAHLKKQCDTLNVSATICKGDAVSLINSSKLVFDGIFADPPFDKGLLVPFIERVLKTGKLAENGWLYVEYEANLLLPEWPQLVKHREKRTGQFVYALYYLQ